MSPLECLSFRGSSYNIVLGLPFPWVPVSHGRLLIPRLFRQCSGYLHCSLFFRDFLMLLCDLCFHLYCLPLLQTGLRLFLFGCHYGHHLGLRLFQDGHQMFHHLLCHLFHFCILVIQLSTAVFSPTIHLISPVSLLTLVVTC
jgi:hypothetical protein